jgi:hypothetical protein
MNIQVHIERLVLDGIEIAYDARPLLQTAVQAELTRLLTTNGLSANLQTGGARPAIYAQPIQLSGSNPTHLGRQIAQAVYGGMNQ